MKPIIFLALCIELSLAYHDPDLNYHLSQVQKVTNCDHGYSYTAPTVQLTASGIKTAAAPASVVSQQIVQAPAFQYSPEVGYSRGITYQPAAPKITYATPPVGSYQTSSAASNYATAQDYARKEVHGYATSAGLSSAATNGRTVIPSATYAQAPIIAKVTAAPLRAIFALSPARTSYAAQNFIQQAAYTGSLAKASLNSNNVHVGGPVVSQVYAAPSAGYATSDALKVQQASQYIVQAPVQYSSAAAQYQQVSRVQPAVSQYTTSRGSSAASLQYFLPAVSQYTSGNFAQYSAPVVAQQAAQAQYTSPAVSQYSPAVVQHSEPAYQAPTQYSAPAIRQYSAPAITHYSAPSIAQYSAPAVSAVGKIPTTPISAKNVHREFLENYDAHPRYAYEYNVNDPHTGDIKQQKEERDGEVVKGQYSLVEPDGSVRTVNYFADWDTGFHADVHNSKDNQH